MRNFVNEAIVGKVGVARGYPKIYFRQSLPPTSIPDESSLSIMIDRVKYSGIPNIRLLAIWDTDISRLQWFCTQLVNAGFRVDVLYSLRNMKTPDNTTAEDMHTYCSLTDVDDIGIISWMTYGGWGTPLDWLKQFNSIAKMHGHTFSYQNNGELAYMQPHEMLMDTDIIAYDLIDMNQKNRESYMEPYEYQWRVRWIYPRLSKTYSITDKTSAVITNEIKEVKEFAVADGTFGNLVKFEVFAHEGDWDHQYITPEQKEGVIYLLKEMGRVVPGVAEVDWRIIAGVVGAIIISGIVVYFVRR